MPVPVPDLPDQPDPDHVLTWRQRKVLQVIRDSVQRRGYPPSMREIGEAVGLTSTSSVSYQLSTLQNKGYLRRDAGRPRTVEVRLPGHPAVRPDSGIDDDMAMDITSQEAAYVPVVGRIAAGGPILAEEAIEDIFPLPRQLVGEGTLFLLKVVGDSMMNAGIVDGDWVVVRQQPVAENGDIIAAMIDGEATVKTFKRSGEPHLADAAQPRLHADSGRRGRGPRQGRGRAAVRRLTGSTGPGSAGTRGRCSPAWVRGR